MHLESNKPLSRGIGWILGAASVVLLSFAVLPALSSPALHPSSTSSSSSSSSAAATSAAGPSGESQRARSEGSSPVGEDLDAAAAYYGGGGGGGIPADYNDYYYDAKSAEQVTPAEMERVYWVMNNAWKNLYRQTFGPGPLPDSIVVDALTAASAAAGNEQTNDGYNDNNNNHHGGPGKRSGHRAQSNNNNYNNRFAYSARPSTSQYYYRAAGTNDVDEDGAAAATAAAAAADSGNYGRPAPPFAPLLLQRLVPAAQPQHGGHHQQRELFRPQQPQLETTYSLSDVASSAARAMAKRFASKRQMRYKQCFFNPVTCFGHRK